MFHVNKSHCICEEPSVALRAVLDLQHYDAKMLYELGKALKGYCASVYNSAVERCARRRRLIDDVIRLEVLCHHPPCCLPPHLLKQCRIWWNLWSN